MNLRTPCRLAASFAVAWIAFLAGPAAAAPPVIQCPPPQVTYEQGGVYVSVTASDVDGDPVTLSVVNPPRRSTFDAPSGYFTWVPDFTQAGSYAVVFRATAGGQTAECTLPITVGNWNRPPRITCPAPLSGTAGDTLRAQLTATDPDADPLTFSAVGLPAGASVSPQGAFSWVTNQETVLGNYAIEVRVSDGGFSVGCTFAVTVGAAVFSPQIICPAVSPTFELDAVDFALIVIDHSGLDLTISAQNLPPGATFNPSKRRFYWIPTFSQAGEWTPTFTATNGQSPAVSCSVTITVVDRGVNPLVTCPDAQSLTELQTITFQIVATNPLPGSLGFSATGLPTGATLHPTNGQFTWSPTLAQAGVHDIHFVVSNGSGSAACDVRITVNDRPVGPPILNCPTATSVLERRPVTFSLSAIDPLGLPLTFSAPNLPRGATFDPLLRRFDWTPGPDQSGTYLPRFVVQNGYVAAACTVQVVVIDRAVVPPDVTCPGLLFTTEQRLTSFVVGAVDPEGDPLSWTVRGLPAGAVFAPDGRFTWTPDISRAGLYDIEFVSSDGEARDSCRMQLQVADHDAALDPLEPVIVGVRDVPQDQGGWVEVRMVTAMADAAPGGQITGYNLWRRLGAAAAAASGVGGDERSATLAIASDGRVGPGMRLPLEVAALRQFPPGTWQSVSFTPALQTLNLRLLAPTR
ncbi:MAG: putative Ig domain-containing protein, partial [Candidatus Eisenbacteria bacterium]